MSKESSDLWKHPSVSFVLREEKRQHLTEMWSFLESKLRCYLPGGGKFKTFVLSDVNKKIIIATVEPEF